MEELKELLLSPNKELHIQRIKQLVKELSVVKSAPLVVIDRFDHLACLAEENNMDLSANPDNLEQLTSILT